MSPKTNMRTCRYEHEEAVHANRLTCVAHNKHVYMEVGEASDMEQTNEKHDKRMNANRLTCVAHNKHVYMEVGEASDMEQTSEKHDKSMNVGRKGCVQRAQSKQRGPKRGIKGVKRDQKRARDIEKETLRTRICVWCMK